MEFFNQLPSNPWAWLFTVIVAVGGLILAYRSTPQKVLKCKISSSALITQKQSVMSKLSILYDGRNIDNLTVSTITFWNNSFPTINKTDIIDAAPLSIIVNDGEILDVSVLQGGNTPNCIGVVPEDNNTFKIVFDYMDKKEGGIIQIVHTGGKHSIDASRKIKGGKIVVIHKSVTKVKEYVFTLIGSLIYAMFLNGMPMIFPKYAHVFNIIILFIAFASGLLYGWWCNKEFIPKNCKSNLGRYKAGIFTRIRDKLQV